MGITTSGSSTYILDPHCWTFRKCIDAQIPVSGSSLA